MFTKGCTTVFEAPHYCGTFQMTTGKFSNDYLDSWVDHSNTELQLPMRKNKRFTVFYGLWDISVCVAGHEETQYRKSDHVRWPSSKSSIQPAIELALQKVVCSVLEVVYYTSCARRARSKTSVPIQFPEYRDGSASFFSLQTFTLRSRWAKRKSLMKETQPHGFGGNFYFVATAATESTLFLRAKKVI